MSLKPGGMHAMSLAVAIVAFAASPVPARAQLVCSVSSTGVQFGPYVASSRVPDQATGSITVTCPGSSAARVAYSIGLVGTSGPAAAQEMRSAAHRLIYQLYRDPARSEPWTDVAGETVSFAANLAAGRASVEHFTVYGRIPPGQEAPPGTYQDQIVVTLTY